MLLSRGLAIDLSHLPRDITQVAAATGAGDSAEVRPLATVLKEAEREHLLHALAVAQGRRAHAAELLGISRKNLWEKLKAHEITDSDLDEPVS